MKIIQAPAFRPFLGSKIEVCGINYPFSGYYSMRNAFWIDPENERSIAGPFDSFEEAEKELEAILAID